MIDNLRKVRLCSIAASHSEISSSLNSIAADLFSASQLLLFFWVENISFQILYSYIVVNPSGKFRKLQSTVIPGQFLLNLYDDKDADVKQNKNVGCCFEKKE